MVAPSLTDPFFRQMHQALSEELENRANVLVSGGALMLGANTGLDAITTAMKYQAAVSYIEALQFCINLGIELDNQRHGKRGESYGED